MEIELKYLLSDSFLKARIFEDDHVLAITEKDSFETINMKAVYFDTEDNFLREKQIAMRVRGENDKFVATIKWGGKSQDGLHVRGEINANVDAEFAKHPSVAIFKGSEIYDVLKEAEEKVFLPVLEMEYVREEVHVDTGRAISVLSIDEGEIRAGGKTCPILEAEIELYSGNVEEVLSLGAELKEKYNLEACDTSKYQRGLALLDEK